MVESAEDYANFLPNKRGFSRNQRAQRATEKSKTNDTCRFQYNANRIYKAV